MTNQNSPNWILALFVFVCLTYSLPIGVSQAAGTVGSGTPASCTESALASAVSGGGMVSFNCGSDPVTITITSTLDISAATTTIDGGGLITLSGAGSQRIIRHRSLSAASTLTLRNLTITDGYASGKASAANGAGVLSIFQGANPSFKPTLIIENVTFRNNRSVQAGGATAYDYGGGAIYSQGGSVTISNSQFLNNHADNGAGGAVHILQSGLSISGTTFDGNSAIGSRPQDSQGGAIYIDGLGGANGVFSVSESSFRNNQSYNSGGAIYVNMYEDSTRTTIVRSSFENNAIIGGSGGLGGAISGGGTNRGSGTGNPEISIRESTFANNRVQRSSSPFDGSGGALAFAQRARISISNSTFFRNRAEGSSVNANGGALYVVNNTDQFSITNSTFAENSAGWVGGAISNARISGNPGGILRNVLFANNSADNGPHDWDIQQHCSSELDDQGGNFQYPPRNSNGNFFNEVTCFAGKSDLSQRNLPDFQDPQLLSLAETGGPTKTIPLAHTSPAINAAIGSNCPSTDQRGTARNGACDSGAHEFGSTPYLAALTPAFAQVGSSTLQITLSGADFSPSSTVNWNGSSRTSSLVDATTIVLTIPASDLETAGDVVVTISTGSFESGSRTFRILDQVFTIWLPFIGAP
jgi:hypothetical protein